MDYASHSVRSVEDFTLDLIIKDSFPSRFKLDVGDVLTLCRLPSFTPSSRLSVHSKYKSTYRLPNCLATAGTNLRVADCVMEFDLTTVLSKSFAAYFVALFSSSTGAQRFWSPYIYFPRHTGSLSGGCRSLVRRSVGRVFLADPSLFFPHQAPSATTAYSTITLNRWKMQSAMTMERKSLCLPFPIILR